MKGTMTNRRFWYVYILETEGAPTRFYVGLTGDLGGRLRLHNEGDVAHTAKYRPWRLRSAFSFDDEARAVAFERYLKSGSGRAFAKRHF